MNIDNKYILKQLENLLNIPSPTGDTEKAIKYLENEFSKFSIQHRRNNKDALIGFLPGESSDKTICLSAHIDTLGAMVKEIKSNGRLKISQLGGYAWTTIEGEYVNIKSLDNKVYSGTVVCTKASVHVYGNEAKTTDRTEDTIEIRLDEKVSSREDVLALGINVGDFIYIDPRVSITDKGFIKSRHLDDKAGVASILSIIKYFKDEKISPKYDTYFFISNYEEVGHGASASIPRKTSEFLAIDMAAPGDGQTSDEYSVTICAKDSSGPYDLKLRKKLISLAEKEGLNYKIDIYPSYGSDASAALRAGHDIRAALIGPGVDASHSYERTHIDAIGNTVRLAILYLLSN